MVDERGRARGVGRTPAPNTSGGERLRRKTPAAENRQAESPVAKNPATKTPRRKTPTAKNSRRELAAAKNPGKELPEAEIEALIAGHCRNAATELPRGVLGVATAEEFLTALVFACRRRLPDITGTGPKMFSVLVEHGLLAAMPSPRVVPAALHLVAGVSPLLEARSARVWTLWLARVHDPGSTVFAALRARTPASQLGVRENVAENRPLRAGALRAERDRLLAENAELRAAAGLGKRPGHDRFARINAAFGQQAKIQKLEQAQGDSSAAHAQFAAQVEAIRRALGVPDDEHRDIVTVAAEWARSRHVLKMQNDGLMQRVADLERACEELEHSTGRGQSENLKNRAEKAERELAAARKGLELAQINIKTLGEKMERRKFQLHSAQKNIESLEIELVEVDAELRLRRNSAVVSPSRAEIQAACDAEAARVRKIHEKRRPLTEDDEPG